MSHLVRKHSCLGVIALLCAIVPAVASADKTCLVAKLQYENKGAYTAYAYPVYKNAEGEKVEARVDRTVYAGESQTFDLDNINKLEKGQEVWLRYLIEQVTTNEQNDCRKDDTRLIFDPDNGNTWNYFSKGTVASDNRCRFAKNVCKAP